jgi:hypothetical protein
MMTTGTTSRNGSSISARMTPVATKHAADPQAEEPVQRLPFVVGSFVSRRGHRHHLQAEAAHVVAKLRRDAHYGPPGGELRRFLQQIVDLDVERGHEGVQLCLHTPTLDSLPPAASSHRWQRLRPGCQSPQSVKTVLCHSGPQQGR